MEQKHDTSGARILKMPSSKGNFGLTRSEFERYVNNLRNGDESLITQVFKSHFHFSVKYLMSKFSLSEDVAYDTCMETMLDFREKLISGKIKYNNLSFLYTRMAVNRFIDSAKHKKKITAAVNMFCQIEHCGHIDDEQFMDILGQSINKLDVKSQDFIRSHFFSNQNLIDIAESNEEQYATIRKRKQRVLQKLKSIFLEIKKNSHYE